MPMPGGSVLGLDYIHQSVSDPIVAQPTLRLCLGDGTDHVMLEETGCASIH